MFFAVDRSVFAPSVCSHSRRRISLSASCSFSEEVTIIASIGVPHGVIMFSIDVTAPLTGVCTDADMAETPSATICPRTTWSPRFTVARAGAPMCCLSGSMAFCGKGRSRIAAEAVFSATGCMPPLLNVFFMMAVLFQMWHVWLPLGMLLRICRRFCICPG